MREFIDEIADDFSNDFVEFYELFQERILASQQAMESVSSELRNQYKYLKY